MTRLASAFTRTVRLAVIPAALLSLTACGALENPTPSADLAVAAGKGKPVNVVKDGGFETTGFWTAGSGSALCTVSSCPVSSVARPHKGSGWAQFGASDAALEQSLSQTLTIPKGRARLEFSLWAGETSSATFTFEALLDGQVVFAYTSVDALADDEAEHEDEGDDDHGDDGVDDDDSADDRRLSLTSLGGSEDETDDDEDFTGGYEKVKFDVADFADGAQHTLTFRFSKDAAGPVTLSVDDAALNVKLLRELLPPMVQEVRALRLPTKIAKPLVTRLETASAALNRHRTKDALKQLAAFSKEVRGHRGKKIKAAAADKLIQEANEVIELAD